MAVLPAAGAISSAVSSGVQKQQLEALRGAVAQMIGGSAEAIGASKITIAGDAITPAVGVVSLDTEAGAGTDNLSTINTANLPDGSLLLLRSVNNARTVVVKNAGGGAGQILTADGADFSLVSTKMWLLLKRTGTDWEEVGRLYGDRLDLARSFLGVREKRTSNLTLFVRTDGSDANNGLANNAGGAFLTIQKAVDVASAFDLNGYTVTIQVADGTYNGAVNLKTFLGAGSIVIQGNTTTPANVVVSTTSSTAFNVQNILGLYVIKALKIATTTSGDCVRVNGSFTKVHLDQVEFGACAGAHLRCLLGGNAAFLSGYAVSGGALNHLSAEDGGMIYADGVTVTYSNAPAFSAADFAAYRGGIIRAASMTFANGATVTGKRYDVSSQGVIFTNGGGASYIPGNVAGTATAATEQYV